MLCHYVATLSKLLEQTSILINELVLRAVISVGQVILVEMRCCEVGDLAISGGHQITQTFSFKSLIS